MLYSSEHEMMHGFIRGLALPLYLALEYLIVSGAFLSLVVNHVRTYRAYIEIYGRGGKRPYLQYSVSGTLSRGRDPLSGYQYHLQPIRFIHIAP